MQLKILEEDIAIVESQDPEQIPHPRDEIAVPPDKVSLTYRRCLYDMCRAKAKGPEALNDYMNTDQDDIWLLESNSIEASINEMFQQMIDLQI